MKAERSGRGLGPGAVEGEPRNFGDGQKTKTRKVCFQVGPLGVCVENGVERDITRRTTYLGRELQGVWKGGEIGKGCRVEESRNASDKVRCADRMRRNFRVDLKATTTQRIGNLPLLLGAGRRNFPRSHHYRPYYGNYLLIVTQEVLLRTRH